MKQKILIIGGVVALAVIAALSFSGSNNKANAPTQGDDTAGAPEASQTGQNPDAATGANNQPQNPAPAGSTGGGVKTVAINITNPASGDKWEVGKIHAIKWSKAAGISGGLELVDSATGNSVGWILSQTAANQTSYDWDTKQVAISRNSALGKQVNPGNYIVRLVLDNKSFAPAQSAVFSISYPSQISVATYNVTIQSYAFGPKSLTIKQGDKVVFTNYDSVEHTVVFQSMPPIALASGATYTLQTGSFSPASYNYYCSLHPSMTGTLIIQ